MKKINLKFLFTLVLAFIPNLVFADTNVLPTPVEGVITLEENVTLTEKLTITEDVIIDLNNNILKFTKADNHFMANVTIKNGTINIDEVSHTGDGILEIGQYGGTTSGQLTLDNITFTGKNYNSSWAVLYVYNTSQLNINKSTLTLTNDGSSLGGVIKSEQGLPGIVNITNSTLTFTDTVRGIVDGTVLIQNSNVTITSTKEGGLDNAINAGTGRLALTIDGSNINISNAEGRGITLDNTTLNITNESVINITNCGEGEIYAKTTGTINADRKSTINAVVSGATGPITITGGTYTPTINDDFIAEGYYKLDNEDGSYTILKIVDEPIIEAEELDKEEIVEEVKVGVENYEETKEVLLDTIITDEELTDKTIEENIKVTVEVETKEETEIAEETIKEVKQKIGNKTLVMYFDITAEIINTKTNTLITNMNKLNKDLTMMILLPEELKNTDKDITRTYYIVRKDSEGVTLIDTKLSENGNYLTFKSDKFSTYTLAYEDKIIETEPNPQTYDGLTSNLIIGGLSLITLSLIIIYIRKKELFN